jgi:phosphoribosylanthranilate isomerase
MRPEIIKVCGLTSPADALAAVRFGADAVGFVFFGGSPRAVKPADAAMISGQLPTSTLKVGVFVDEEPERLRTIASMARLDVVQLHGNESAEYCAALKDFRVWKAVRIGEDFDAESLAAYDVEAFLLDTASGDAYGGTGRTFPWPKALAVKKFGKVILAGGLDGGNVAEAIRAVDPWGVDASSKLEAKPGVKDHERVKLYVEAAKSVK